MKKITAIIMAVLLSIGSMSVTAMAEDEIKVTLRIEGVAGNFFYDTVTTSNSNLGDFFEQVNEDYDISIVIEEGDWGRYLTDINGDKAGDYGDYSGWLFTVNGEDPGVGMDGVELNDGDSVVLYYGDPYGVGFQYPETDTSAIDEGIIAFTSKDTVYDENYNASLVVNPVAGATVNWYTDDTNYTTYTTDDSGKVTIDEEYLTNGTHKVTIEKYADNGVPVVLRLVPDYTVTVEKDVDTADASGAAMYAVIIVAMAVVFTVTVLYKKRVYEK